MRACDAFPPPQGLYDPRHEHDACGVAFVATLTGEPSHDIVAKALTALRNLDHRGAAGAEANSGDGAGILHAGPRRVPPRRSSTSSCRRTHAYAVGTGVPPRRRRRTSPRPAAGSRSSPPRRASPSSAGATCPVDPTVARRHRARRDADVRPAVRRRRGRRGRSGMAPGAAGVLPAQARRARDRRLLPVAVGAHPRLQGHAHHRPARPVLPRPDRRAGRPRRWPSCTRASPPTPSRAGRWRTRSGSSPTTARSTP